MRVLGHFLDVDAALGGGHEHDPLLRAVDHQRGVVLLLDRGALLDQQALHLLARGAGLVGHELHAEDLLRPVAHLVDRLGDLDPAALAAPAGVDLRLHHRHAAVTQPPGDVGHIVCREGDLAARHRDTITRENGFGLIFVDFHGKDVRELT